jgi:hypothetical protein
MLPPKLSGTTPDLQRLSRLFRRLSAADRASLLAFAEFLVQRHDTSSEGEPHSPPAVEPRDIPRPEEETVIAAIRRLNATYPMLNKDELLHEASDLMAAHVVKGREADEVIDQLEIVFRRHFERVRSDS